MALYNMEGELDESAAPADPWRAAVRREGADASLVTFGGSLPKCLAAAETLAGEGISVEVLDLRSLRPLDTAALARTAAKTHRVVVVDEGWKTGSLAAEVVTRLVEHAFYELDAPIERVCSVEVPIPYAKHLEDAATPQPDRIAAAVRRVVEKER
jgi:pyruvate dehydrogenase E1 component beta subunit